MSDTFTLFGTKIPIPDDVCRSFPHVVCNETVGLKFSDWCSVCQEKREKSRWPAPGTKLKYNGERIHWFDDMRQSVRDNLVIGEIYTLKTCQPASSWCPVTLEETGDLKFELSWFTKI